MFWNPGPGGWGVVLQAINAREIAGKRNCPVALAKPRTITELMAAISALETLERASPITVVTDIHMSKMGSAHGSTGGNETGGNRG